MVNFVSSWSCRHVQSVESVEKQPHAQSWDPPITKAVSFLQLRHHLCDLCLTSPSYRLHLYSQVLGADHGGPRWRIERLAALETGKNNKSDENSRASGVIPVGLRGDIRAAWKGKKKHKTASPETQAARFVVKQAVCMPQCRYKCDSLEVLWHGRELTVRSLLCVLSLNKCWRDGWERCKCKCQVGAFPFSSLTSFMRLGRSCHLRSAARGRRTPASETPYLDFTCLETTSSQLLLTSTTTAVAQSLSDSESCRAARTSLQTLSPTQDHTGAMTHCTFSYFEFT